MYVTPDYCSLCLGLYAAEGGWFPSYFLRVKIVDRQPKRHLSDNEEGERGGRFRGVPPDCDRLSNTKV